MLRARKAMVVGHVLAGSIALVVVTPISQQEVVAGGHAHSVGARATHLPARGAPMKFDNVRLRLQEFASGFSAPLLVTHAGDGSGLVYVVEQGGVVRVVRRNGRVQPQPFLDISDRVGSTAQEQGLLGLAFHPLYKRNRRFYVNYTDSSGETVVAEYQALRRARPRAEPGSERVILTIEQPFNNHNGGMLEFGPDGYLYIATGDGGSGGNPLLTGQRLDTLLGKILRIDVDDEPEPGKEYSIPPDNPFVGDDLARDEIYFYGLRHPWRFSFDRRTGNTWIADVGQFAVEEVNRVLASEPGGLNFGWNIKEGDRCFATQTPCDIPALTDPIAVYANWGDPFAGLMTEGVGCSVTGGYVYRGSASAALRGAYVFGDFCSGRIWLLDAEGPSPQDPVEVLDTDHMISSFGEDEKGEIYLTDWSPPSGPPSGRVMRVVGRKTP